MTDKTKYKSVAIDHDCYKKIEELALSLHPGVTLSRAQVVKILVNNKCLEDEKYSYESVSYTHLTLPTNREV